MSQAEGSAFVRTYGDPSHDPVILIHGGPGAPGYLAPVARELAGSFHVLEPFQRRSGERPVTVEAHVRDLAEVVRTRTNRSPHLVGSSWGAMLALAYACEAGASARSVVLIGSGTWDLESRTRLTEILEERMTPALEEEFSRISEIRDPDERLDARGRAIHPLYAFDPLTSDLEMERCDGHGNRETWADMVRLQEEGVYPAAFRTIECPVLMLHGDFDPHPGDMIRDSLLPHLPRLEFHEWPRCGHYPWIEREWRSAFFSRLLEWLGRDAHA